MEPIAVSRRETASSTHHLCSALDVAVVINQLRSRLDTQGLLSLSRIVLLEKGNPVLEAIHKAIKVRHGMAEARDSISFGVPIKHAYSITSARENSLRSRTPQPA
jgi:hypothetical protein